jgi:hypothetical protein
LLCREFCSAYIVFAYLVPFAKLQCLHIFLKSEVIIVNDIGMRVSDVADMPGLKANSRNILGMRGISDDKSVFPRITVDEAPDR